MSVHWTRGSTGDGVGINGVGRREGVARLLHELLRVRGRRTYSSARAIAATSALVAGSIRIFGETGLAIGCFAQGLKAKASPPPSPVVGPGIVCFAVLASCLAVWYYRWSVLQSRVLRRPYIVKERLASGSLEDPAREIHKVVEFLQDVIVRPIDERLPGRPFEFDLHSFPFTPMVLVIGNHSSGKSTFVNRLLGTQVQETGVAPTDDGFTLLERASAGQEVEDGPTVLGCPENRPFRELQRFGQAFSGHLRRKRMALPVDAPLPFGLQVIDTPGMIDLPANFESTAKGRGYNFIEVVRWWAKRADLVLLLFDPDKPGTTGETLEVLTKSLAGLDHKLLVILNKVDQLDNSVDFARAYGALGWALSKVIRRKDIPMIYTMFNSGFEGSAVKDHRLPLEAFARKRSEVVEEVLRAKIRHNDNVVTSLEETLRQIQMVATVLRKLRSRVRRRLLQVQACGLVILGVPALALVRYFLDNTVEMPGTLGIAGIVALVICMVSGVIYALTEYYNQFERLQAEHIDDAFQEAHAHLFIHDDGEDLRSRWQTIRPIIKSILRAVPSALVLPIIAPWETDRIEDVLEHDVWYLRQIARMLRTQQGAPSTPNGPSVCEGAANILLSGSSADKAHGSWWKR